MKVITFGCRLNTFESRIVQKMGDGLDRVIVVNSCAVTQEAERQCRQAIRRVRREYPDYKIIVTGCAAQLNPEKYAKMPEVDRVLGNKEKLIREALYAPDPILVGTDMIQTSSFPLVTDFEGRTRAFLQIQQGCDHACTFCIVHMARGKNRGLHPDLVVRQAKTFIDNGFSEIVLTGVDLTSYPYGFNSLLRRLLTEVSGLKRLRLGSLDPAALDDEFIHIVADFPSLMPHFHLSVQAGDDLILKRMGRRHTKKQVIDFTRILRKYRSDIVLGGDFITGFPTETSDQFQNTLDLVQEAQMVLLHVFPYSVRLGTPAAKMPQVDISVRKERAKQLRVLGENNLNKQLEQMIGKRSRVLIEKDGGGLTENYIRVQTDVRGSVGEIVDVLLTERRGHELVGKA